MVGLVLEARLELKVKTNERSHIKGMIGCSQGAVGTESGII